MEEGKDYGSTLSSNGEIPTGEGYFKLGINFPTLGVAHVVNKVSVPLLLPEKDQIGWRLYNDKNGTEWVSGIFADEDDERSEIDYVYEDGDLIEYNYDDLCQCGCEHPEIDHKTEEERIFLFPLEGEDNS